jgi:hypothetical protein
VVIISIAQQARPNCAGQIADLLDRDQQDAGQVLF